jgi:hypothetical protein
VGAVRVVVATPDLSVCENVAEPVLVVKVTVVPVGGGVPAVVVTTAVIVDVPPD